MGWIIFFKFKCQYRFLSNLSTFTSKFFYNGEITNDISVETRELPDYLMNVISKEKNFIFFNTNGIQKKVEKSFINETEA